jgi:nucleotide-binding universal stress UspA family protein
VRAVSLNRIVVGVDGSAEADAALRWALAEAKLRQLPVRAIGVWYPAGTPEEVEKLAALRSVAELRSQLGDDLKSHVDRVVEAAETDVAVTPHVLYGHPADRLIEEADDDALLVVGSRGRGAVKASMLGSVSHSCAQYARCPVAVVRGPHRHRRGLRRVVVGVDGSSSSVRALRFAHDAAAVRKAQLFVVHAWTLPSLALTARSWQVPREAAEELRAQAGHRLDESLRHAAIDPAGSNVEASLVEAFPATALLGAAKTADLLVVGTRGNGGWKGLLLGSVSMQCLAQSPCPVIVTRDEPAS